MAAAAAVFRFRSLDQAAHSATGERCRYLRALVQEAGRCRRGDYLPGRGSVSRVPRLEFGVSRCTGACRGILSLGPCLTRGDRERAGATWSSFPSALGLVSGALVGRARCSRIPLP